MCEIHFFLANAVNELRQQHIEQLREAYCLQYRAMQSLCVNDHTSTSNRTELLSNLRHLYVVSEAVRDGKHVWAGWP